MRIQSFARPAAIAALGLLVTTTMALAAPNAIVTNDANVRAKPKSSAAVVNAVEEDDMVTVLSCQGSWCKIKIPGPDGWVKKSVLESLDDEGDATGVPFSFGMTMGPGGPSISFGVGDAPVPMAPAQACFFKGPNYTGESFCAVPGESDGGMVGGWNDNISSVALTGGAKVKLCVDPGLAGACVTYAASKPGIGGYDDSISSFSVY